MTEVKLGDVVKLPSGGPEMTVVAIKSMAAVTVAWFNGDEYRHADLNKQALTVVKSMNGDANPS